MRIKEVLIKLFDKFKTNGNVLITFVMSLSSNEHNQHVQNFLKLPAACCGMPYLKMVYYFSYINMRYVAETPNVNENTHNVRLGFAAK